MIKLNKELIRNIEDDNEKTKPSMVTDYSFTCEMKDIDPKAIDQIKELLYAGDGLGLMVELDGKNVKVAKITRDKDCPKELFQKVMEDLLNACGNSNE